MNGSADAAERPSAPRATLTVHDGVAITVGIVLGAGIFRAPSVVAQGSSSTTGMMLLWLAGGLIALFGALCYAELASAWPNVGGDYHFLRRAFGRRLALLYAWARLAVIQTGSLAVLAFVFGDYAAAVLPLGPAAPAIYAGAAVTAVTAQNWAGLRPAAGAQRWLVPLEVAGLLMVIAAGLLVAPAAPAVSETAPSGSVGLAMVFVLLTFGGWSEAAYAAVSPILWWNRGAVAKALAAKPPAMGPGRRVFVAFEGSMATGPTGPTSAQAAEALTDRSLRGRPDVTLVRFADEKHDSIYHPAALAAFRTLYAVEKVQP